MNECARNIMIVTFCLMASLTASAQYKLYERGFDDYKKKNYADAVANFSEFLSKSTRDRSLDGEVRYLRGLSHYQQKNYNAAIADFQDAILLDHPKKGNIYWFMAKCHEETGFYPDGMDAFSNAIRLLKSDKEIHVKLLIERAKLYEKMGDLYPAYLDYQQARNIQPGNEIVKKALTQFDESKIADLLKTPKEKTTMLPAQQQANNQSLAEYYKNEKRYALVIGNSIYPKEIGELRNPVNDATDMAAELQRSNFEVQLLTNATYGQMRAELMKFKEKLDAGDHDQTVGLFYFAGHGLRQGEENYLVPVDATIEFEDDVWRYCFPVQRMVLGNMERSHSRLNIVILDACRSNPFPSLTRSLGQQGLIEMQKARGSFVAYATAPGSVASDGLGRNGLYTQELLKAFQKSGLTIEEVFKEVRQNVLRLSGQRQQTWDNSNIIGEFFFKF